MPSILLSKLFPFLKGSHGIIGGSRAEMLSDQRLSKTMNFKVIWHIHIAHPHEHRLIDDSSVLITPKNELCPRTNKKNK